MRFQEEMCRRQAWGERYRDSLIAYNVYNINKCNGSFTFLLYEMPWFGRLAETSKNV